VPKVHHVKKARKTNKRYGIIRGEPYWWWKTRTPGSLSGIKRVSLKPPRPSDLAGSPFVRSFLSIQERVEDMTVSTKEEAEEARDGLREAASDVRELRDEEEEKYDSIPDSLKESPSGEVVRGRRDGCESTAESLDEAAEKIDDLLKDWIDEGDDRDDEDRPDTAEEVAGVIADISWEIES
jgi:hypothetical protein